MLTTFYNYKTIQDVNVRIQMKSKDKPTWPEQVLAVCFSFSKSFPVNNFCSKTQTETSYLRQTALEGSTTIEDDKCRYQLTCHLLTISLFDMKKLFVLLVHGHVCSVRYDGFLSTGNSFVLTAALVTLIAWTEPSGWLRTDLRKSISVDRNTSLTSISWKDRQIRTDDNKRIKCFALNGNDFIVLSQQSKPNSLGHNQCAAPGFPPVTHNHPPSCWTWYQACPHRSPSWPLHTSWFGKEPWWGLSLQARSTVTNPPPGTWYLLRPQKTFLCLPGRDKERTKIRTVDQLLKSMLTPGQRGTGSKQDKTHKSPLRPKGQDIKSLNDFIVKNGVQTSSAISLEHILIQSCAQDFLIFTHRRMWIQEQIFTYSILWADLINSPLITWGRVWESLGQTAVTAVNLCVCVFVLSSFLPGWTRAACLVWSLHLGSIGPSGSTCNNG